MQVQVFGPYQHNRCSPPAASLRPCLLRRNKSCNSLTAPHTLRCGMFYGISKDFYKLKMPSWMSADAILLQQGGVKLLCLTWALLLLFVKGGVGDILAFHLATHIWKVTVCVCISQSFQSKVCITFHFFQYNPNSELMQDCSLVLFPIITDRNCFNLELLPLL